MGRIEIYTKDKYKSWKNTKTAVDTWKLAASNWGRVPTAAPTPPTVTLNLGLLSSDASGFLGRQDQEEFQGQWIDCSFWGRISSSSTYPKWCLFQLWNFTNHQTKILWHPHWMDGGVTLCGTTGAWVTCFAATGLSGSRNRKDPPRNKSFACTGVITEHHGG